MPVPTLSLAEWITLGRDMTADVELQRRYVGVWHLIEPPSTLRDLVGAAEADIAARTEGP